MSEVGAPGAGASAPAEGGVVIDTNAPYIPNPSSGHNIPTDGGETTRGQPPSAEKQRSIDDSLDKAFAKAEKEAKPEPRAKPEPKPKTEAKDEAPARKPAEAPPERERGERGRFAPRAAESDGEAPEPAQNAPHAEPPARFSPEAKQAWAKAPPEVQAEAHRAIKELENGYSKYREAAESYHEVRQFDELAKQTGTTLPKALANYVTIERQLASDDPAEKWEGIQRVLKRAGVEPRQLAAAILNQPAPTPDQREAEHSQAFTALHQEIAGLKQQLQGVASVQQQAQTQAIEQKVTSFAKGQPRFDELSAPDIEHSIQNLLKLPGMVPPGPPEQRLAKAYELADRLNPATGRQASITPEPRPANGAGTRSIAGSPANGSDPSLPAKKGKHSSIDESLDRAFLKAGL